MTHPAPVREPSNLAARFAVLLVAAAPVIFGLSSWNHGAVRDGIASTLLGYSIPISLIEMVVIVITLLAGIKLSEFGAAFSRRGWATIAALFAIIFGTAMFVAPEPAVSMFRSYAWAIHFLFGLSIWALARAGAISATNIWPQVLLGVLGYLVLLVAFVATIPDPARFDWVLFNLGVTNVRQLGFYATFGYMAAFALAILSQSRWTVWIAACAASLFFALACWSGTRSAILAIAAALVCGAILMPAFRKRSAIGTALITCAAGALLSMAHVSPDPSMGLMRMFSDSQRPGADTMSSGRLTIWKGTAREIAKRPFFGYGESQFRFVVPESARAYNHPHNSLLQVLLAWGIIGGALFFGILAHVWWRLTRLAQTNSQQHAASFLVVNALLAMSLIEGSLFHPYPVMMLVFAFAVSLGVARPASASGR